MMSPIGWVRITHGAAILGAALLGVIAWSGPGIALAIPLVGLWAGIYRANLTALRLGAMALPFYLAVGVMEVIANADARPWASLFVLLVVLDLAAIIAVIRTGEPQRLADEGNR